MTTVPISDAVPAGTPQAPPDAQQEKVVPSRVYRTPAAVRALAGTAATSESVPDWLVHEGRQIEDPAVLVDSLCWRLVAARLPLDRATFHVGTLHPQYFSRGWRWRREPGDVAEFGVEHGIRETRTFRESPLRPVFERAEKVRRRLEVPDSRLDFPILVELKADGFTDYVALPLMFSRNRLQATTWATRRAGGFADAEIERIERVMPTVALLAEILSARGVMATVLGTYLGRQAGARVLAGDIKRGEGETIRAVIWRTDLRGFTRMSDSLPAARMIEMLDAYFERVVAAVHAEGGEVLKFIGDGTLAIFPIAAADRAEDACARALAATAAALASIAQYNRERAAAGDEPLTVAVALHLGDVIYGNIGAPDRLDFTVIGPAVNLVSRIEQMSRPLGRTVLLSDDFARAAGRPFLSLGFHPLRGLRTPHELFTLPEATMA